MNALSSSAISLIHRSVSREDSVAGQSSSHMLWAWWREKFASGAGAATPSGVEVARGIDPSAMFAGSNHFSSKFLANLALAYAQHGDPDENSMDSIASEALRNLDVGTSGDKTGSSESGQAALAV